LGIEVIAELVLPDLKVTTIQEVSRGFENVVGVTQDCTGDREIIHKSTVSIYFKIIREHLRE
jgi:hypothetical protein